TSAGGSGGPPEQPSDGGAEELSRASGSRCRVLSAGEPFYASDRERTSVSPRRVQGRLTPRQRLPLGAGIACGTQAGAAAEYTSVGSPSMSASLSRLIPIFMATLTEASFAGSIRQIRRDRFSSPNP